MKKISVIFAAALSAGALASAQDVDLTKLSSLEGMNVGMTRASVPAAPALKAEVSAKQLPCPVDSNVPEAVKAQLDDDFSFISSIKGPVRYKGWAGGVMNREFIALEIPASEEYAPSKLHKKIFGELDGENYAKFFSSRVKSIGLSGCGSANAVACVIPFMGSSKMWLTQNYIKFSHPQIARLMVVFHESRHTETQNRNWPHATCPTPFQDENGQDYNSIWTGASLAGESACDVTPYGSYGSSLIMLKNIQKYCANCTDKVKMDAGIYADDQLNRITSEGARNQMVEDLYR